MKFTPRCDCLLFDPRPVFQDRLATTGVDIDRGDVVQTLVVAHVVVVVDDRCQPRLQFTRQVVVLQQDPVLH